MYDERIRREASIIIIHTYEILHIRVFRNSSPTNAYAEGVLTRTSMVWLAPTSTSCNSEAMTLLSRTVQRLVLMSWIDVNV